MSFTNQDRVSKRRPCPICGNEGWCLRPVDTPELTICMRVESRYNATGGGWLHWADDDEPKVRRAKRPRAKEMPERNEAEWATLNDEYRSAIGGAQLAELGTRLAVSDTVLDRLGFGWSKRQRCWTCPMYDGAMRIIGIQTRFVRSWFERDLKRCVTRSHLGLFIPRNLSDEGHLLICEGASDTATVLDRGLDAIGRPSANSGAQMVKDWLSGQQRRSVTILADANAIGQRTAEALATLIGPVCRDLRLIVPFQGAQDVRSWAPSGDVLRSILANAGTLK